MAVDPPLDGSVVTLGTFDGVHRGHQALVARALQTARAQTVPAVAYTFDPHPAQVVAPRYAPQMLQALDQRVAHLKRHGIDMVVVEPFDETFAAVAADDWVERYLWQRLRPVRVVIGFNFTYGRERGGNPEQLRRMGAKLGFGVDEVEPVKIGPIVASSSRVREFVLEGNVEAASELLGRPFALTGRVVEGDRRGRELGFPTANLSPDAELIPAHGVYASRVSRLEDVSGGPAAPAITNVGMRPTFRGQFVTVETHLLDFDGDLYGQRLKVELVGRIRGEQRFDGIDALKAQIQADIQTARSIHGTS